MRDRDIIEALRPFAEYAEQMQAAWKHHSDSVYYGVKREGAKQITYGDFGRAKAVHDYYTKFVAGQIDQTMMYEIAMALCDIRGFGFYTDPMEGGQDAYDISMQALFEAEQLIKRFVIRKF